MTQRRDYDLKVARAEKHLVDLESAIGAYINSDPYTVRVTREGKRQRNVYRFHFTSQPDDAVALIAGDFLYNIRSTLDYLAAALVPAARRRSVLFPIFFQGVWEDSPVGENAQRVKQRQRWDTVTRDMHEGAVAILKEAQPPDSADSTHALAVLNRLSNKDRHNKLVAVASALLAPVGHCTTTSGEDFVVRPFPGGEGVRDGTEITLPKGVVEVYLEGTPVVLIRDRSPEGGYSIPDSFRDVLLGGTLRLIDALRPFDRL